MRFLVSSARLLHSMISALVRGLGNLLGFLKPKLNPQEEAVAGDRGLEFSVQRNMRTFPVSLQIATWHSSNTRLLFLIRTSPFGRVAVYLMAFSRVATLMVFIDVLGCVSIDRKTLVRSARCVNRFF